MICIFPGCTVSIPDTWDENLCTSKGHREFTIAEVAWLRGDRRWPKPKTLNARLAQSQAVSK